MVVVVVASETRFVSSYRTRKISSSANVNDMPRSDILT